ncbi:winged helix-turn-helix domain-containing protein [Serratia plymuthica]|uniref:winged helix-turn-helix domain-containing protein n=1 Tax=Serratia plymuthica TaxID=82996 RepID=UPI001F52C2FF|nr:winged helix-turn-helix domain-containing protein [Serratia plymuthica]UNK26936.1 winged helix-turn-helix domain-containing protein [Serratia plymuthica]
MKYIINKIVVFNSEELTLFLYENNQVFTKLTKPASRLLLELIQNNKKNITRDDLLERVWTTYGFTASNAGLNNYISELRKAFSLLGLVNEIIVTIPKLGFRFEAEIVLTEAMLQPSEPMVSQGDSPDSEVVEEEKMIEIEGSKKHFHLRSLLKNKKITVFIVLAVSALLIAIPISRYKEHHNYALYTKVSELKNCEIYVIGNAEIDPTSPKKVIDILNEKNIYCVNSDKDVFYSEDRFDSKLQRAELISVCSKNSENHYDNCLNIKLQRDALK